MTELAASAPALTASLALVRAGGVAARGGACVCIVAALLLAGCKRQPPAPEAVNVAYEEQVPPGPPAIKLPPCKGDSPYFEVSSNAWGHGSAYFGLINKCRGGVKVWIDLWGGKDATYDFSANQCPDAAWEPMQQRLPKVDDRRGMLPASLRKTRKFLESELAKFRKQCGLAPDVAADMFEGFEETYAGQLKASWIHNDYIDRLGRINRLGWGDKNLQKEAQKAYAQTH